MSDSNTRHLPGFDAAVRDLSADDWAALRDILIWAGGQPTLPYMLKRQRMTLVRAVNVILAELRQRPNATRQTPRLGQVPGPALRRPPPSGLRFGARR